MSTIIDVMNRAAMRRAALRPYDRAKRAPASPAVSVVLPVYNALPHLTEALESLFAQDCDDFEIVAIDDASTDGSADYLDGISDPRLRVLHCPKQGLTRLLNLGLREARAPLVAR